MLRCLARLGGGQAHRALASSSASASSVQAAVSSGAAPRLYRATYATSVQPLRAKDGSLLETNFYGEKIVDVEDGMTEEQKAVKRLGVTGALRDKEADKRVYIFGVNRQMMQNAPEALRDILQIENASGRQRAQVHKHQKMDLVRTAPNDTGSTAVQVAAVTARLETLIAHKRSKSGKKDMKVKRTIQLMQGKRRRLLKYAKRTNVVEYVRILETLNLKPIKLYQRHNTLAPVSVIDQHHLQVRRRGKYKKSNYQHLFDVPTAHNLQHKRGPAENISF